MSCPVNKRAYTNQNYNLKKTKGECVKCSNEAIDGLTLCASCCEKSNERKKKQRVTRRELNKCLRCGETSRVGKALCSRCANKENAEQTKARDDRRECNVCLQCGEPPLPHYRRCQRCLDLSRVYAKNRRDRLTGQGLCDRCGNVPPVEGSRNCETCLYQFTSASWLKSRSHWKLLKDKFDEQQGMCPYLGVPIRVGIDASIDHKVPRSRGGTNDLDNLQWVHVWANLMKMDSLENEFLNKLDSILPRIVETRKAALDERLS